MSASIPSVAIEYDMPDAQAGGVCSTQYAWAKVPRELSTGERLALKEFQNPKLQTLYAEEFKINFFPSNPEVFIADLYQACQRAGVLKKLPTPDPKLAQLPDLSAAELKELIAKAQTDNSFERSKELVKGFDYGAIKFDKNPE